MTTTPFTEPTSVPLLDSVYIPLSLSSNSHNSNSTPQFLFFLQITLSAIPRSSETFTAPSSSAASLATPPKTLFVRSLLFSTLSHSLFGCRESLKENKKIKNLITEFEFFLVYLGAEVSISFQFHVCLVAEKINARIEILVSFPLVQYIVRINFPNSIYFLLLPNYYFTDMCNFSLYIYIY